MRLLILLSMLCGCAAGRVRDRPREAPMNEAATYGPSRVIYVR
jgi:hypothetical protein